VKALLALVAVSLVATTGALAGVRVAPGKLVLKPAQVGPKYVVVPFLGGNTLKQPTLDMCHMSFPSEKLRVARRQIIFQRLREDPTVSNEVVNYKPGGAAQAMREVRAGVQRCPKGPVTSGTASLTTQITVLHPKAKLLPGAIALSFHQSGTVGGKAVTQDGVAVYQRKGDTLSGVYAYTSTTALRTRIALHAAEQSALNLERAAG
jgi:hypothetical protein